MVEAPTDLRVTLDRLAVVCGMVADADFDRLRSLADDCAAWQRSRRTDEGADDIRHLRLEVQAVRDSLLDPLDAALGEAEPLVAGPDDRAIQLRVGVNRAKAVAQLLRLCVGDLAEPFPKLRQTDGLREMAAKARERLVELVELERAREGAGEVEAGAAELSTPQARFEVERAAATDRLKILKCLRERHDRPKRNATQEKIADETGLNRTSKVLPALKSLEGSGFVRRHAGAGRGFVITDRGIEHLNRLLAAQTLGDCRALSRDNHDI